MKPGKLLLGLALIISAGVFAQEETEQERECKRMRFLAGKQLDIQDYKSAATYYLKGEEICGGYEMDNYDRTIATLRNVISAEQDPATLNAYIDTVLAVYKRAEEAGQYNKVHDLSRAAYMMQLAKPDRAKANDLFVSGMKTEGDKVHEAYIGVYYYNLYMIFAEAPAEKRSAVKKDIITEYFNLSSLVGRAGMSAATQENLNTYFNAAVQSCEDILPELAGFMSNLPQDADSKKVTVKNFITLLETKQCTSSAEYATLIDTLIAIDPTSIDALSAKAKLLESKGKYSSAIAVYKEINTLTDDADLKEENEYKIVYNLYKSNSYTSAYNAAMGINGKYRGDAMLIAANSVANNANNCGASTFDRKCNYYYAYDLAEKAKAAGTSGASSAMNSFQSRFPSDDEIFENNMSKGQSVTLSCYGVSVTIK